MTQEVREVARRAGLARLTNHRVARLHYLITGRTLASLPTEDDRRAHFFAAVRRARRAGNLRAIVERV